MIAGVYGAAGVLTALRVAEKTGKGQLIDLSLFEPILSVVSSEAAKSRLTGKPTLRSSKQAPHAAPRNLYRSSDGRYVAPSGSMQAMAMRILDTIGRPELKADPRFVDNDARVRHHGELDRIIGEFVAARTQAEKLALFDAAHVTLGPVCTVMDLLDHPYAIGREALVELPDDEMGTVPMHNVLPWLALTPGGFRRPAPALGEHTAEILAELAADTTLDDG